MQHSEMSDDYRTVWVGGLTNETTDAILFELFMQAGPVEYIRRPKEKGSNQLKPFAFVCFKHDESVPYCIHLLNGIFLYGRNIKVQNRNREANENIIQNKHKVGIHSLDPEINKEILSSHSSSFKKPHHERSLSGNFPLNKQMDYMQPSQSHPRRQHSSSFSSHSGMSPLDALGGPIGYRANHGGGYNQGSHNPTFDLRNQISNNQMNAMKQNYDNQSLNFQRLQHLQQTQGVQNSNYGNYYRNRDRRDEDNSRREERDRHHNHSYNNSRSRNRYNPMHRQH